MLIVLFIFHTSNATIMEKYNHKELGTTLKKVDMLQKHDILLVKPFKKFFSYIFLLTHCYTKYIQLKNSLKILNYACKYQTFSPKRVQKITIVSEAGEKSKF